VEIALPVIVKDVILLHIQQFVIAKIAYLTREDPEVITISTILDISSYMPLS